VKRYGKHGRKASWIVKWYGKYGRKVSWKVKRYGKYGRKVVKVIHPKVQLWNYGSKAKIIIIIIIIIIFLHFCYFQRSFIALFINCSFLLYFFVNFLLLRQCISFCQRRWWWWSRHQENIIFVNFYDLFLKMMSVIDRKWRQSRNFRSCDFRWRHVRWRHFRQHTFPKLWRSFIVLFINCSFLLFFFVNFLLLRQCISFCQRRWWWWSRHIRALISTWLRTCMPS
jgi:hypothetical protein